MRQRDKCLEDLRKVTHTKMREAELKPLESDIKILEMRLGHAEKSRDYEVCGVCVCVCIGVYGRI